MTWLVPAFDPDCPIPVHLVGAGGTGSMLATRLAKIAVALQRLNVGHPGLEVTIWDDDVVSPSNVGRQAFFEPDIGHKKALVLVNRINLCEGLEWTAKPFRIKDENQLRSHGNRPIVLTAVDSRRARHLISRTFAGLNNMLWLDCGNNAHTGQVVLGARVDGKTVLPSVVDLFPEIAETKLDAQDDQPSCSLEEALLKQDLMINPTVANTAASLLWQVLRHGQLDFHGAFVDVKRFASSPIRIDADYWRMLGWDHKRGKRLSDQPKRAARKRSPVTA